MFENVGLIGMSRYLLSRKRTIVTKHLNYENGCPFWNFKLVLYLDFYIGMYGGMFIGGACGNRIVNIFVLHFSLYSKNLFTRFFFFLIYHDKVISWVNQY